MIYPSLTNLKLLQKSKLVECDFDDHTHYQLPCEYLRVFSPSAEVRGHGLGQEVLQTGKRDVNIIGIDPVGNYAVKLIFDDGHQTGIYSFETLYDLCKNYEKNWKAYLEKLEKAGGSRDPH